MMKILELMIFLCKQFELNYGMMILMIVGMMNFLLGAQFLEESVIWDETVLVLLWCKLS